MKKLLSLLSILICLFTITPNAFAENSLSLISEKDAIKIDYFDKISLASPIPKTFYQNEVYIIDGEITTKDLTASIIIQYSNDKLKDAFYGDIDNKKFSIPVYFDKVGSYSIGIIAGDTGSSKAAEITVSTSLPSSKTKTEKIPTITYLDIAYENDNTYAKIKTEENTFKKIVYSQNSKTVEYISRQNKEKIPIKYSDFKNFKKGQVEISTTTAYLDSEIPLSISSSFSTPKKKTFQAEEHTYDQIEKTEITANIKGAISIGSKIEFSGKVISETNKIAYVIKPDGFVETITLSSKKSRLKDTDSVLKKGDDFTFSYKPSKKGRYIVEINNSSNFPIVNSPVYVGSIIPLIPDYFDYSTRSLFNSKLDLTKMREELLSYINLGRKSQKASAVVLDEGINKIAQSHADDMAKNNFFGHENGKGEMPEDRRIKAGLKTPISENIAKDVSIKFAHEGLMRSASHRKNILQKDWNLVGIGIAKSDGYLYIVEEFAQNELTSQNLTTYKTELLTEINKKRASASKSNISENGNVASASAYLNNKVIKENIELTNENFNEALNKYKITGSSLTIGRTYNIWSTILDSILKEETTQLTDDLWKSIGINLQLDDEGSIHAILILNSR
ncbi:MAG: CAP domain-containing protein [Candidatus Gracilibacteria bacterium]|jgi:uncharacterized protein YkwD